MLLIHLHPAFVQRTEFDGTLVASRMVEGQLRLVMTRTSSRPDYLPLIQTVLADVESELAERTFRYETREEYLDRALQNVREFWLDGYRALTASGDEISESRYESYQRSAG